MVTAINSAQTHTLTLFRCLQPNIQRMCGDQDLKVSVTLNWLKEGEREENIYPCGGLGNKILALVGKAGHKTITKGAQ